MTRIGYLLLSLLFFCSLLAVAAEEKPQAANEPENALRINSSEKISRINFEREKISVARITGLYPDRTSDLFKQEAGIRVEQLGGLGFLSHLSLRGSKSEEILLMLNGARLNLSLRGAGDIDILPLELIESIEFAKGPASAVYGAGATGGAVNLQTNKPQNEELITRLSMLWSKYGRETYRIKGGQKREKFSYHFAAHDTRSSSFKYRSNHMDKSRFNSAYESAGGFLSLGIMTNQGGELHLAGGRFTAENGLPGADTDGQESTYDDIRELRLTKLFSLGYEQDFAKFNFSGKYYSDNNLELSGEDLKNDADRTFNQGNGASLTTSYLSRFGRFSLGGERYIQHYWSDLNGNYLNPTFFRTTGYFLKQEFNYKDYLSLTGSYRNDYHSRFGRQSAHQVGLSLDLPSRTRLRAENSSGYRFPAFEDLYWPQTTGKAGDDDLLPANSLMSNVGITQEWGDILTTLVSYYSGEVKNHLEWYTHNALSRPRNVDVMKWGVETGVGLKLFSFLSGQVNHTQEKILYRFTGKTVVYQPSEFTDYQVKLQNNFYEDDLTAKFIYGEEIVGAREVNQDNTEDLPAYQAAYAILAVRIVTFEFYLKGTNLYNEAYETREGYPAPERDIRLGINWSFGG